MDVQITKLINSIEYHKPTEEQTARIEEVRAAAVAFAKKLDQWVYPSRERSLAITSFEETVMWAVKGIVLEVAG